MAIVQVVRSIVLSVQLMQQGFGALVIRVRRKFWQLFLRPQTLLTLQDQ